MPSGKNGTGKSSVLAGASIILSWIIARLRNDKGVGSYISKLDVNNNAVNGCIIGSMFGSEVSIPSKAKAGFAKEFTFDIAPIREYVTDKRKQLAEHRDTTCVPVFAYYGVKRAVLDMPLRTRHKDYSIFDAYDNTAATRKKTLSARSLYRLSSGIARAISNMT